MKFTKMHGCGNDYVYFDCTKESMPNASEVAIRLSDRHFGIGGDGIILVKPSEGADFYMEMYNADGSQGKMCGNGIRCVAKLVYDSGLTDKTTITVETLSGIKTLDLFVENGKVAKVTVNMGHPSMNPAVIPLSEEGMKKCMYPSPDFVGKIEGETAEFAEIPHYMIPVDGENYVLTAVSMGNPHAIIPVADTKTFPVEKVGSVIEKHMLFPEQVNTEFIHVTDRKNIDMRVWERGSGETWACGTGACAVAYACYRNGWSDEEVTVHLLGGDLEIRYDKCGDVIYMTGPATTVCTGEVEI